MGINPIQSHDGVGHALPHKKIYTGDTYYEYFSTNSLGRLYYWEPKKIQGKHKLPFYAAIDLDIKYKDYPSNVIYKSMMLWESPKYKYALVSQPKGFDKVAHCFYQQTEVDKLRPEEGIIASTMGQIYPIDFTKFNESNPNYISLNKFNSLHRLTFPQNISWAQELKPFEHKWYIKS